MTFEELVDVSASVEDLLQRFSPQVLPHVGFYCVCERVRVGALLDLEKETTSQWFRLVVTREQGCDTFDF